MNVERGATSVPRESATLFRSFDVAVFAAALTQRLRSSGIDVGLSSTERFSQGLEGCPPRDTATLYWVARTCLVHDRRDIAAFDAVFVALFDDESRAVAPGLHGPGRTVAKSSGRLRRRSSGLEPAGLLAGSALTRAPEIIDGDTDESAEPSSALPELLPASVAGLADTPFDELEPAQLELLGRWLEEALVHVARRRSRRFVAAKSGGAMDMRRTLLAARGTGGEPIRLRRRRSRLAPRGIVMLADVSGSMESFTRIYLHLMRSLVMHGDAEVFTFSTSLRRVTVPLRDRDPRAAIDRLTDEVTDRFGGTRIGTSIGELLSSPVWSNAVRGSLVVIASDGWDVDAPRHLEARMARLKRMAHRVIWINPRVAADDYEPLVGAMAAALPYVDELFSGHTLNAMRSVLDALGDDHRFRAR